jgi:hypothetical protein
MADETQGAPQPTGTGPGTTIEKFKSAEDRDRAYLELEKQNSEQARRLADIEAKLDAYATMAPQTPQQDQWQPQRSFTDMYPSQKSDNEREAELAAKLLTRPSEVLRDIERRTREEVMREVRQHNANEAAVARFRAEHPDLVKHEEIVAMFVRKQPENLSPEQRLRLAIPESRKYLASLSGQPSTTTLDPAAYVESPTQRPGATPAVAAEPSDEDELSAIIRERTTLMQKKMRV